MGSDRSNPRGCPQLPPKCRYEARGQWAGGSL
jgi:hypothetical protein